MESKKSILLPVITLALVAATLVFCIFTAVNGSRALPVAVSIPGNENSVLKDDVVAVYGQGKMTVKPDVATMTFGVTTTNRDPKAAQDANAAVMEKVVAAVKSSGIADADIQTAYYNVYPDNDNNGKILGYRVNNEMKVTVKQIEKAAAIIKAASDAGANIFSGIHFDILARQKAYTDALNLAVDRAREKAELLAGKDGRKISGVLEMEEASGTGTPYYSPYSNFVPGQSASNAMADYAQGVISSGEMEITAVVNMKYKLE